MRPRRLAWLKYLFAAISLGILLQVAPLADVAAVLGDASVGWLVLGVALQFLTRGAATFRMQVVAGHQGLFLSRLDLFRIQLANTFYSLFLPGLLTGAAVWLKYLQHGAGKAVAAAVIVFNRAVVTGVTIVLGLCAWLIDRPPAAPLVAPLVVSASLLLLAGLVLLPAEAGRRQMAVRREPTMARRLRRIFGRVMRFRTLSRRERLLVMASTIVETLLNAAIIGVFAATVGAEIGFLAPVWIRAALLLVLTIPVTVAGLGIREASLVGFGVLLGIPPAQAIAWSFTILLGTLVVGCTGALVESNATSRQVSGYLDKPAVRERSDGS